MKANAPKIEAASLMVFANISVQQHDGDGCELQRVDNLPIHLIGVVNVLKRGKEHQCKP